jgi:hypothetical protein
MRLSFWYFTDFRARVVCPAINITKLVDHFRIIAPNLWSVSGTREWASGWDRRPVFGDRRRHCSRSRRIPCWLLGNSVAVACNNDLNELWL